MCTCKHTTVQSYRPDLNVTSTCMVGDISELDSVNVVVLAIFSH